MTVAVASALASAVLDPVVVTEVPAPASESPSTSTVASTEACVELISVGEHSKRENRPP